MTKALAATTFGVLVALAAPAAVQANVIYTFDPTTVTRTPPLANPYPFPTRGFGFSLELTDGASANGGFNLIGSSSSFSGADPFYGGDIGAFVRFSIVSENVTGAPTPLITATPTSLGSRGNINLSLTFSASGDVTTGRIVTRGEDTDLDLSISNNFVSGYFGSDEPTCNAPVSARVCLESGPLVRTVVPSSVPEPGSLALLGVAALGLGAVTRRRRGATAA